MLKISNNALRFQKMKKFDSDKFRIRKMKIKKNENKK